MLNRFFAQAEGETLVAWGVSGAGPSSIPRPTPTERAVPGGSGSLGDCKMEKQLVWLTQQGKTLIYGLETVLPGGEEMKDLVGPCSSSFLPHCGLEGSQSPFYLLSFRKGFFCQSSCTAAQELFEAKINLYFMWLLLFLSWPFVSFHLLLEAEAYLKQTDLLLALQTDLSSELTDYFYSSGRLHWQKETKGSDF